MEWADTVEWEGTVESEMAEKLECLVEVAMAVEQWKGGKLEDAVERDEVDTCLDASWDELASEDE